MHAKTLLKIGSLLTAMAASLSAASAAEGANSRLPPQAPVTNQVVKQMQDDFLKLTFGMFIHYNMATYKGVPVPKEMPGVSWKELAGGRKPAHWRQSFFAHYYKDLGDVPTLYAVRTTTHKLVKYPNRPEWTEVFDLVADPYEIKNLTSDAALTAKLEAE